MVLRRPPRPAYGVALTEEGLEAVDVVWAEESLTNWARHIVSTDGINSGELQIASGRGRGVHTLGAATGTSNLRQIYTRKGTNWEAGEIRGLWYGGPAFGGTVRPQHGFVLGLAKRGAVWSCIIMWHDVLFGVPWILNLGIWQWPLTPTGDVPGIRAGNFVSTIQKTVTFTDASRTSNVVTAVGAPAGHGLAAGDRISADFVDATYDGPRTIATTPASPGTTVTWPQTAANDASAGAGSIVRTYPHMAALRRNGPIVSGKVWPVTMAEEPDWSDPSYAMTVDLRTLGTGADILAVPTPEGSGLAGFLQGHTTQESRVEYGALQVTQFPRTAA